MVLYPYSYVPMYLGTYIEKEIYNITHDAFILNMYPILSAYI